MGRFNAACGAFMLLILLAGFTLSLVSVKPIAGDADNPVVQRTGRTPVSPWNRRATGSTTPRQQRSDAPGTPATSNGNGWLGRFVALGVLATAAVWVVGQVFGRIAVCVSRDVTHLVRGGSLATLPQHGQPQIQQMHWQGGLIERLCRETGWLLVEVEGDKYTVRSYDHKAHVYIDVIYSERFGNILLQSWFPIRFSLEREPQGLFARLMLRSTELKWAAWIMSIGHSSEACPSICARVPRGALSATVFHKVCEEIAGEVRSFHLELHQKFRYGVGQPMTQPPPLWPQPGKTDVPQPRGSTRPDVWYGN